MTDRIDSREYLAELLATEHGISVSDGFSAAERLLGELQQAARRIDERYPDMSTQEAHDSRLQALRAATEVVLGLASTEEYVAAWKSAGDTYRAAHVGMSGAIAADPRNDVELARACGVSRPTIRKARAKSERKPS